MSIHIGVDEDKKRIQFTAQFENCPNQLLLQNILERHDITYNKNELDIWVDWSAFNSFEQLESMLQEGFKETGYPSGYSKPDGNDKRYDYKPQIKADVIEMGRRVATEEDEKVGQQAIKAVGPAAYESSKDILIRHFAAQAGQTPGGPTGGGGR